MNFIKGLVGELKPMGVDFTFAESLCNRLFGRRLEHLDRAQASTVIGHLNEIKAALASHGLLLGTRVSGWPPTGRLAH